MRSVHFSLAATTLLMMFMVVASPLLGWGQDSSSPADDQAELEKIRQSTIAKGLTFLATKGQAENGSFTERAGAGITALAVTAALRNGKTTDDPMVAKGAA